MPKIAISVLCDSYLSPGFLALVAQTWMYMALPLLLYLGERTLRTLRSEASTVKILKVPCPLHRH